MSELLTAAEKRKRYESAVDESVQKELEIVTNLINNAVGESIIFNKALTKPVQDILIQKGYKCGFVSSGYNESEYVISW